MADTRQPKRVLVTGATGFIGHHLAQRLSERGDRLIVHARNPAKARRLLGADAELVTDLAQVPRSARVDAVVNLAGESIAGGPWTERRRQLLLDSRLGPTAALLALVARLDARPTVWLNASAIGFYGAREGDAELDETASCGTGFQAELCRRWEAAALEADSHGTRVAVLRFGVVLGAGGGALPALARPVRGWVGTVLGTGRQWFSWIHLDDLIEVLLLALDRGTLRGPINATAPNPVRYAELMAALAATLHRPLWPLKIPAWPLRFCLGELAELFVDGQRVVPARLTALGFGFRYPTIGAALVQALGPRRELSGSP